MDQNGNADFISNQSLEMYLIMSSASKSTPYNDVEDIWWRMMLGREHARHTWDPDLERDMYASIKPWKKVAWERAFRVLIGADKFPIRWTMILEGRLAISDEIEKYEF